MASIQTAVHAHRTVRQAADILFLTLAATFTGSIGLFSASAQSTPTKASLLRVDISRATNSFGNRPTIYRSRWMAPLVTTRAGTRSPQFQGSAPGPPEMIVGPVLVTVLPAVTAKEAAVPNGTGSPMRR